MSFHRLCASLSFAKKKVTRRWKIELQLKGKEEAGRVSTLRDTLSSRIHLPTSATGLHPYSAIAEETSGANRCCGGEASRRRTLLAILSSKHAAHMIYILFHPECRLHSFFFFYPPPFTEQTFSVSFSGCISA